MRSFSACVALVLACVASLAPAAKPAAELLPPGAVGFLSVADTPDFRVRWNRTQIGRLAADATMKPFTDRFRAQLNRKFGELPDRLGVTAEELMGVATGEAAFATLPPLSRGAEPIVVAILDTTGSEAEAAELVRRIEARLAERGAKRTTRRGVTTHALAADAAKKTPARKVAITERDDRLVLASDPGAVADVLARLSGKALSLATDADYSETIARATSAAGRAPATITWFLDPFEYERVNREADPDADLPDKKGTLQVLAEQGFDAVSGLGGVVSVAPTSERDFIHHTCVYAPAKPGAEGKPAAEKYELGMRMLSLPNDSGAIGGADAPVEPWTPRQVATYKTFHVDIQNAFDHLDTVFDAFAGFKDAFQTTLTSFEKDPYGPQINVRDEVIAHLGSRIVVMTDYTLPINPECERYLMAIDVTDEEALREPIAKWLKTDGAELRELDGVAYWELIPEEELEVDEFDPGLLLDDPLEGPADEEERVLRRAAVCLHAGRLFIGSDADFLRQALFGVQGDSLVGNPDLAATMSALQDIAPGRRCAWNFIRNDESFRPTYELIRAGRMPESQTFFGRLLNRMLTSDEQREVDALRDQKIDGKLLPTFEMARRYFGPSARSVRSDDDGWLISGVVLSKDAGPGGASQVAVRRGR